MAAVGISLSQNTASTLAQLMATPNSDTVADDLQLFFGAALGFSSIHGANNTATHNGSDVVLSYADGNVSTINNPVIDTSGKAVASGFTYSAPGLFDMHMGGKFSYYYDFFGGALSLLNSTADLSDASFKTAYASSDSHYNPTLGNATLGIQGQIHSAPFGSFSGTINTISGSSDHFLTSMDATGTFNVSGNGLKVGLLQSTPSVSGVLNGYHERYEDGSSITIDNAQIPVTSATGIDRGLVLNGANFKGNDVFTITLPANLSIPWHVNAGDGNDTIIIKGDSSQLSVDGGAGADTVVLSGTQASYTVSGSGGNYTVRAANGVTETLANIERIQFSDGAVAYDTDGAAGQIFRLYQAAFNRAPDAAGMGNWIKAMDQGASLRDVANGFAESQEFHSIFGATPSNADIVDHLYQNALHRSGEAAGVASWLNLLNTHQISVADALIGFSESTECRTDLATVIGSSIAYTPIG